MTLTKENNMKNTVYTALFLSSLFFFSCTESGRIDRVDADDYIPQQVEVKSVHPFSGGAVIKYALPDDINLRGVRAEYQRSGETVFTQVSRYVDSIKIEGLADTNPHRVKLYGLGKNNALSSPVDVDITPGTPTIQKIKLKLFETFGGVRLIMDGNEDRMPLAMTILKDTHLEDFGKDPSQMEWEELFTYYTSGEEAAFIRYGLDTVATVYGVCARDRWLSYTDTTYYLLKPYEENELPNSGWKTYYLPGDETVCLEGKYQFVYMWDGSADGVTHVGGFTRGPRRRTFTIDMGYTAAFSRMRMQPRIKSMHVNSEFTPWHWQIWGSMAPNPDGSFDDSWYLLGDFTQKKLSGLSPDGSIGPYTTEDDAYFLNNNDYEFEQTAEILNPQRETRYIRLVLLDSAKSAFTKYDEEPTNVFYLVGELMFWGKKK